MAKRRKKITEYDPFGTWQKIDVQNTAFWKAITSDAKEPTGIWVNKVYQVVVYREYVNVAGWPTMHWLSIKRLDKQPIHDWRDLQRIKNELIGSVNEAVELYPAEQRMLDTSNQYHLWVLADPKIHFPFGFSARAVVKPHRAAPNTSAQRPWPKGQEPKDALTPEEFNALCNRHMAPVPSQHQCPTCQGDTTRPHLCGVGKKADGTTTRYPIYTDDPKNADAPVTPEPMSDDTVSKDSDA